MKSSRFVRPEHPTGFICLTARDRAVFAALKDYRLLYTRHIQALVFPTTALRQVQRRLRLLWERKFLDRSFRPVIFDGTKPFSIDMAYCLGPATEGMEIAGDILGPPKAPTPLTFEHEIAVADCLSALTAACRGRQDVQLMSATPAAPLWRTFRPDASMVFRVPDGAIQLRHASGATLTYYIEIVRADVRGGNATLARKMEEYATLNREGRFRERYGHEQVRAVLFLTTSDERAEHFRQLAAALPFGRRLFWFGAYRTVEPSGRVVTSLTPETMLLPRWRTATGEAVSFDVPDGPASFS